jgi:hypothetical protein
MYISQATYEALNKFLQKCFQANSFCDNLTYNMSALNMINSEPIFHEKFAHAFPGFADTISQVMSQLDARPIRKSLEENSDLYDNFKDMFDDLKDFIDQYRLHIIAVIESADINGDIEIKITMEKFLCDFIPYLNQINIWYKKSNEYNRIEDFDQDFTSFTFI